MVWHLTVRTPSRRLRAEMATALLAPNVAPGGASHPHPAGSQGGHEGVGILRYFTKIAGHNAVDHPQLNQLLLHHGTNVANRGVVVHSVCLSGLHNVLLL